MRGFIVSMEASGPQLLREIQASAAQRDATCKHSGVFVHQPSAINDQLFSLGRLGRIEILFRIDQAPTGGPLIVKLPAELDHSRTFPKPIGARQ